jgi:hypothetical protein
MIQDILGQWIVLHFVGISPTSPPTIEDFSYQLSSLQLGNDRLKYLMFFLPMMLACIFFDHKQNI